MTEVSRVDGDVEVNQRKGKPIVVFDLHIAVNWEGGFKRSVDRISGLTAISNPGSRNRQLPSNNFEIPFTFDPAKLPDETAANGRIKFPEYLNDQTASDVEYEILIDSDLPSQTKATLKSFIKSSLVPAVTTEMLKFTPDIIADQAADLIIPQDKMAGHPAHKPYTPPPKAPSPAPVKAVEPASSGAVKGSLVDLEQDVEFQATAADIYMTLLDRGRASVWSRAPAEIQPGVGLFNLFGGNVSGYITEVEENKAIKMRWRLRSWPEGHFSTVDIKLDQGTEHTRLHLKQSGVPVGEKDQVTSNWTNFYW